MVIHATVAATVIRKRLERQCPQCQHRQAVSLHQHNQPIVCEKCGATIPPKPSKE